jgi:hypothetical protein
MQQDVNSMMREQLYKDGYIMCYSGMKTRRSISDWVDIALTKHRHIFFTNDDDGAFVNPETNIPGCFPTCFLSLCSR